MPLDDERQLPIMALIEHGRTAHPMEATVQQHGMHGTKVYRAWQDMKRRCTDPRRKDFNRYGGRGISFDPRWSDFTTFLADMGQPASPDLTLERVDNEKGYGPDNCCWATRAEQNKNQRRRECGLVSVIYRDLLAKSETFVAGKTGHQLRSHRQRLAARGVWVSITTHGTGSVIRLRRAA